MIHVHAGNVMKLIPNLRQKVTDNTFGVIIQQNGLKQSLPEIVSEQENKILFVFRPV